MTAVAQEDAIDDGGPAFPTITEQLRGDDFAGVECAGMSLRDYFAAAALSATIECHQRGFIKGAGPEHIAATAYEIADAMLKARKP